MYNKVWAEFLVNNYFPKKLKPELRGAPLELNEYRDYQESLGKTKIAGKTLMEEFIETVDNFTEFDTRGPDGHRRERLSAVREAYRQRAEEELVILYPEIISRIQAVDLEEEAASNEDVPFGQLKITKSMQDLAQRSFNQ